ncbi:MAG: hypothetical protein M3O02_02805 [Acidobacteriota bacterium]|nr:hypothetical protein [Acidobacteriota bacterium]
MQRSWAKVEGELRERLLRGGVAPRHVRRFLRELAEHLDDLRGEEERAGTADAGAAALVRLGGVDELAASVIRQPQLQAWSARAPLAAFGLLPMVVLAGAYVAACLVLWSGWRLFLWDRATPFVPVHGLAVVYFGVGRLIFYTAPVVAGWVFAAAAARQRLSAWWPILASAVVAAAGGAARVHALRSAGSEHVGLSFALGGQPLPLFSGDPIGWFLSTSWTHALLILLLSTAPYGVWRALRVRGVPA